MAKPSLENGWDNVPNALTDQHLIIGGKRRSAVLLYACHEIFNSGKPSAKLRPAYLATRLGITKKDVRKILHGLVREGLLALVESERHCYSLPTLGTRDDGCWWQLATELLQVLAYAPLKPNVFIVTFYVLRWTWGVTRDEDGTRVEEAEFAASFMARLSGLQRQKAQLALAEAVDLRLLHLARPGRGKRGATYRFNKDYEKWRVWQGKKTVARFRAALAAAVSDRSVGGGESDAASPLPGGVLRATNGRFSRATNDPRTGAHVKRPESVHKTSTPSSPGTGARHTALPATAGQEEPQASACGSAGAIAPASTARPAGHPEENVWEEAAIAAAQASIGAQTLKPANAGQAGGRAIEFASKTAMPGPHGSEGVGGGAIEGQPLRAQAASEHRPCDASVWKRSAAPRAISRREDLADYPVTGLAGLIAWALGWMRFEVVFPGAPEWEERNRAEMERLGALHSLDVLAAGLRECFLQAWTEWQTGRADFPGKVLLPYTDLTTGEQLPGKLERQVEQAARAAEQGRLHDFRWTRPLRWETPALPPPDFRGTPLERQARRSSRQPLAHKVEALGVDYASRLRALAPAEQARLRALAREQPPAHLRGSKALSGYRTDDLDPMLLGAMAEQLRRECECSLVQLLPSTLGLALAGELVLAHPWFSPARQLRLHLLKLASGPASDPSRWREARARVGDVDHRDRAVR